MNTPLRADPPAQPRRSLIGHRGRHILHVGSWSLVSKVAAAANLFLPIPFVHAALGAERFGVWATLVSLTILVGFLDFGFSNGAMNLVAAAHAKDSTREVGNIVREAIKALTRIAAALAVAAAIVIPLLPWHRFFSMPEQASFDVRLAVGSIVVAIVCAIPLNLGYRVQLGLGNGQATFRWQAIGHVSAMATVIFLASRHASLPALVLATALPPTLASLANTCMLFRSPFMLGTSSATPERRAELRQSIRGEGMLFFVLQVAAALAYSFDLALISALRNPAEAGNYAIAQRLFAVIPLGFALIWAPLWPMYRKALAIGDRAWTMRTLRHSIFTALALSAVAACVFFLAYKPIVAFWVRSPAETSAVLIAGLAVWSVVDSGGTALATFLNAASVLKFQLVTASVFATICIAGKIWVIAHGHVEWIPWVTLIAYLGFSLLPFAVYRRRIMASVFARTY